MQKPLKFSPFITYNATTNSFDAHAIPENLSNKQIKFISVIEVKMKDYRIFGSSLEQLRWEKDRHHGIYLSECMELNGQGDYYGYVVLSPNEGKVGEKMQDFLAGIALMLSNVCVFDISSKYVRLGKNIQDRPQRNNYVIMSSHSNGSELFKANISNQNNKMQITTKIQTEQKTPIQQLTRTLCQKYNPTILQQIVEAQLRDKVILKNYTTLQQILYRILGQVRLCQYLECASKDFRQLWHFYDMVSTFQIASIQKCIDKFTSSQFTTTDQIIVLSCCKQIIKQKIKSKNIKLTKKFILELKQKYFTQIISQNQLQIKKQLCEKILEEYGIQRYNLPILFSESQSKLHKEYDYRQNVLILEKESKIQQLEESILIYEKKLRKCEEVIQMYETKNFDFKQLNIKYQDKCTQLQKQRNVIKRCKIQIQSMQLQMLRKNSIEQSLHKLIKQCQNHKQNLTRNILQSQSQIRNKQKCICQLQSKNEQLQTKIKNHQNLQGQAWKCIEQTQLANEQLKRYKQLVQKLQNHFDVFKNKQVQKFNYVLKKNAQQYFRLKKQVQNKNIILQQYKNKMDRLYAQLEQERIRVKFCQEQMWMTKNGNSINLLSNIMSSSVKKTYECLTNREQGQKQQVSDSSCKSYIVV